MLDRVSLRRAGGMTLVEVMLSIALLSFGLLGVIGLKLAGLSAVSKSSSRSLAALHASEMIDRLRANAVRARAGEYNLTLGSDPPQAATSISATDLREWRGTLSAVLPYGTGSVDVSANSDVSIIVQWRERVGDGGTAQTMSYSLRGRL